MMRPQSFLIFILPLVLFCGCAQALHNVPVSLNQKVQPADLKTLPEKQENCDTYNDTDFAGSEDDMQLIINEALYYCETSQGLREKGSIKSALEKLDNAYSLILVIDTNKVPELIQQKEDIRFMISKRILEIYASRNVTVNGSHNAIPVEINRHVQAEIDLLTKYGKKAFFIKAYKRSGKYRPQIVEALKEAGLPTELSWLPLIESGFEVTALSSARALGLWQFIPSTGYKFGLKRDQHIDERLDPVKSTKSAIAYLKELHRIFGDWATVLAAYNCGEENVLRIIREQNVNYLDNFWDLYKKLPRETARYVPRFIATLYILNNPEKYGLDSVTIDQQVEYETVQVSRQVHLENIAKKIGITKKTIKELNPELRYNILPSGNYSLNIPPGKEDILLSRLDTIPISHLPTGRPLVYHKVKHGDTLSSIARRYRTSVTKIARLNNIRKRSFILVGKVLKIPQRV